MKTIEFDGVTYACPFADLLPPLSERTRADLRANIATNGVEVAIVRTEADEIIDGYNRLSLAAELGLPPERVKWETRTGLSDPDKERLANELNDHRRHYTPEQLEERRAKRIQRVAAAKADGKSIRTIAEQEGVSHEQVRMDLEDSNDGSGVKGLTPEPESECVTGKDGKTYRQAPDYGKKAQKLLRDDHTRSDDDVARELGCKVKTVAEARKALQDKGRIPSEPPSSGEVAGEGSAAVEPAGPEPVHPADDFVAAVESLCRDLDQIAARIRGLKESPYSYCVHWQSAADQVSAARSGLWNGRPTHDCPYCEANGEVAPSCRACRGTGRVYKGTYDRGVASIGGAA